MPAAVYWVGAQLYRHAVPDPQSLINKLEFQNGRTQDDVAGRHVRL